MLIITYNTHISICVLTKLLWLSFYNSFKMGTILYIMINKIFKRDIQLTHTSQTDHDWQCHLPLDGLI